MWLLKKLFYIGALSLLLLTACSEKEEVKLEKDNGVEVSGENTSGNKLLLDKQDFLESIIKLIEEDDASVFNPGDYISGEIPEGNYAFVGFAVEDDEIFDQKYHYSEENKNGETIDFDMFDSFGYVYVHGEGNVKTEGALINESAFEKLKVNGAKQIFELLYAKSDYVDAGYYKVGVDIPAGSYVLESNGEGYAAIETGPVGDTEIITNNKFNGKYQVDVEEGQYLTFTKASIKN